MAAVWPSDVKGVEEVQDVLLPWMVGVAAVPKSSQDIQLARGLVGSVGGRDLDGHIALVPGSHDEEGATRGHEMSQRRQPTGCPLRAIQLKTLRSRACVIFCTGHRRGRRQGGWGDILRDSTWPGPLQERLSCIRICWSYFYWRRVGQRSQM